MIRVVVALRPEASPLVGRFDLQRVAGSSPFRLYRGLYRDRDLLVAVSGVGKLAAAAAAGYLLARSGGEPGGDWLNLGIGGHPSLPVGEAVLAAEVRDAASGRRWALRPPPAPPCAAGRVITVDETAWRMPEEALYEMEAAGFCAAAARFTRPGRMQVLKVVSDHGLEPAEDLSDDFVALRIAERMEVVEWLFDRPAD